jgi:hypothetical protein
VIIGDPYRFSVLFDRVEEWNEIENVNNGFFALCLDGKIFPKYMINAIIETSLHDVLSVLKAIPEDGDMFCLETEVCFKTIYDKVFPDDYDADNDYRYLLSPYALTDENCFIFILKNRDKVRIMGAELKYDIENSTHIFDDAEISVVELTENDIQQIIDKIEVYTH